MAINILFIFEGEKAERAIVNSLMQFFVEENTVITCVYCTTIYKMYKEISEDEDLDTFSLLKAMDQNRTVLEPFKRSDFAEIYMFFDYDGHASNASDEKLEALLAYFNEETDKGKLYMSYPMVEALKHIEDFKTFEDLTVACKVERYKQFVNACCLNTLMDFNRYDAAIWRDLIVVHLKKMNRVVFDLYEFPSRIVDQATIFSNQLKKYIQADETVAVLSAFPVFLHDYYGNATLKERLAL